MSDQQTEETEHYVRVESTQVFVGEAAPSEAALLTGEGDPPEDRQWIGNQGVSLQFDEEIKCTYECSCGQRFRKPETAREHLEEVR